MTPSQPKSGEMSDSKADSKAFLSVGRSSSEDLPPAPRLPRHKFWGAGESDCPQDLKAPNGELHTMRCKVCGDGWRKSVDVCFAASLALREVSAAVSPNEKAVDAFAALLASHQRLAEALSGLLEIEDARIKTGAFKPNAEAARRIEAARAAIALATIPKETT